MEFSSVFLIVLNSLQFVKPGNTDNGETLYTCVCV